MNKLGKDAEKLVIMAPFDTIGGGKNLSSNDSAVNFWEEKYQNIKPTNEYQSVEIAQLKESFVQYCERIQKNNNMKLVRLLRTISPISAFKPCIVYLNDLEKNIKFDYVSNSFHETTEVALLSMQSESLNFMFKNSFGFDTLTVNGCFEEETKNGFVRATKTLAIENLNNLGIKIQIKTLFNFSIIKLFLTRLYRVARKLDT